MPKGFRAIGHCAKCGDTQGPWSLYPGWGWVCDQCAEELEKVDDFLKEKDEEDKDEDEKRN